MVRRPGSSGRAGLTRAAVIAAAAGIAQEHPGLYAAIARGAGPVDDPTLAAASTELIELARRVLPGVLGSAEDRLHAVRGLRSLVHGFVSIEAIGGFGLTLDTDESFLRAVEAFAAGLRATSELTA